MKSPDAQRRQVLSLPMGSPALAFLRIAVRDHLGIRSEPGDPQVHLDAAGRWLKRAHDMGEGGVSYGYSLKLGWRPPYRETSGYILVTFLDLAEQLGDLEYRDRAIAIARWLCDVQNADGSISNPEYGAGGIVFDTGQVLQGYVRAYQATGERVFLTAANRAADWLVEVADPEGRWTRNTFLGVPHAYNTRVAWPLMAFTAISPSRERERVARTNLDWALAQVRGSWFDHCSFKPGAVPVTHTIAYAIEGLLEAGLFLGESKYLSAAFRSAETLLEYIRVDGFIPGEIDTSGNIRANYCCLTGNSQMAVVWAKLYRHSGDERFYRAAVSALRYVMARQDLDTSDPNIYGGIKGSQPVSGAYARFTLPSWASKFFVDAMLLCRTWLLHDEPGS